jgi:hypothetical protein
MFIKNDEQRSMLDALVEYRANWPGEDFSEAKMSRDLKELKADGFLDAKLARPKLRSKHELSYVFAKRSKMTFSLSENAKAGKLGIDANRWVIVDGSYVAPEMTRQRVEAREKQKVN